MITLSHISRNIRNHETISNWHGQHDNDLMTIFIKI